jgi:hypothetical protein
MVEFCYIYAEKEDKKESPRDLVGFASHVIEGTAIHNVELTRDRRFLIMPAKGSGRRSCNIAPLRESIPDRTEPSRKRGGATGS